MSTLALLAELREQKIKIHVQGDQLKVRVPSGGLDPQLKHRLQEKKGDLIAFLTGSAAKNYPLSRGQRRMWVLSRLLNNPPSFAVNWAARSVGVIDPLLLQKAVAHVVERHETLRTRFRMFGYRPHQVVVDDMNVPIDVIDFSKQPPASAEKSAQQWLETAVETPFDLEAGPLLRVGLLQIKDNVQIMFISIHRLVADTWSMGLFLRELEVFYHALRRDEPVTDLPLPKQYQNFVRRQREWLRSSSAQDQMDFWIKQLLGRTPVLELPTDKPRPQTFTYRSGVQQLVFPSALKRRIQTLADQEGANLFMILLAAYQTLLARFAGREEILVGSPFSDRDQDTRESIGFYANWLVFRNHLGGHDMPPSFRKLLSSVRETVQTAYANKDLPFERLISELQPERDLSRHPIFQYAFILRKAGEAIPCLGTAMERIQLTTSTAEMDLTLVLRDDSGGLKGSFEYNRDLFEAAGIARLSSRFLTLLEGIASFPDAALNELPVLTEMERERLLYAWNDSYQEFPQVGLFELFEAQVSRSPNAVAVDFQGKQMSYLELNRRAGEIGYFLRSLGVGPDVSVAICLERSFEMVIGILGILKAGGAYVPLDPDHLEERLDMVLKDVQAPILLTRSDLLERLPHHAGQTVLIDKEQEAFAKAVTEQPLSGVKRKNLAFIHYHTTLEGDLKGVMTTHMGAVNRLMWMREYIELGHTDRVLQKTPFSYDISTWEFFLPLITGASVVMAKPGGHRDPAYLVRLIEENQISLTHFTPSMLQACLDVDMRSCTSLKRILCSEETLSKDLYDQVNGQLPEVDLHNIYGPPEISIDVSFWVSSHNTNWRAVPIGKPISNARAYVLDDNMQPVPIGVEGELYIGGESLSRGFLNDPARTAAQFVPDPFSGDKGGRLYRTGDLVRYLADGNLEYLGHIDHQQRVAGSRIEYGEIKAILEKLDGVRDAIVTTRQDEGPPRLVAYYIPSEEQAPDVEEMRNEIKKILPNYMCPDSFEKMDAFPLTPNGRINPRALPAPKQEPSERETTYARAYSLVERTLLKIWKEVLGHERISVHDDFFELGGDSLRLMQVYDKLPDILKRDLDRIDLFKHPIIHELAFYLEEKDDPDAVLADEQEYLNKQTELLDQVRDNPGRNIAVVGMSFRFPGAGDPKSYWELLKSGASAISWFSREELAEAGVDPQLLDDEHYVPVRAMVDNLEQFDHNFFGYTPREAQLTDPQHRLLLECAWNAMEYAGYCPSKYKKPIGLFAGVGENAYLNDHLMPNRQLMETAGRFSVMILNTKDNLSPKISYKLGLTGPSMVVQTACSTSLVAIHTAVQSLQMGDCDMALAGGVSLGSLQKEGYLYEEGMLQPPDGVTRSFDARAMGSIPGQGGGMVVLKRLEDAVLDGDRIYAVIKGSAITNDGADKTNYTNYSADGQAASIMRAHQSAGIKPEAVRFIETSSTASKIGDPIEYEGIHKAFTADGNLPEQCALGAVKANIGNLDTAAGLAAFCKTVLAVHHGEIPPTLNFEKPHPTMNLNMEPFYVNTKTERWLTGADGKRIAGVSAFGLGGTNAHMILENAPPQLPPTASRPWQLLTLSAKTPEALDQRTRNLAHFLKESPDLNFSEIAYTLHVGREDFQYRRMLTAQNLHEAVLELERPDSRRVYAHAVKTKRAPVVFMFPGQGAQYLNMGRDLYRTERTYRQVVDECWDIIQQHVPNLPKLYRGLTKGDRVGRTEKLNRTYVTQPALFITEYALAKTMIKWGVEPEAMIGNSLGEYVAACVAEVFTPLEALDAIVTRGRLMQKHGSGAQIMVSLSESELQPFLGEELSLAAVTGENTCVLSGSKQAVNAVRAELNQRGIESARLHSNLAFHSKLMEPVVPEFLKRLQGFNLKPPKRPFISNVTGTWITDEQATNPHYWVRHLLEPVRFHQGLQELFKDDERIYLEIGPENTLGKLVIACRDNDHKHPVLGTLPQPMQDETDLHFLLNSLGRLWLRGVEIDWTGFHGEHRRRRLAMPTYPFNRQRHWIEPVKTQDHDFWLASDEIEDTFDDQVAQNYEGNVGNAYVAPRNPEEEEVASLWREFLGIAKIGIHDDFFELGGTSLIAVRLTGKLSQRYNVPLASHTLIKQRTIATLAEYINEHRAGDAGTQEHSPLVEIQHGNPRVLPLVMVHPVGGEVYFYKDLAQNLGSGQPVFGIQAPSLVGDHKPFNNIEEQSAFYIQHLLKNQPKGPYVIGGASYGGVVAYEMSQQLQAMGLPVALTVLVDSPAPGAMPNMMPDFAAILEYLLGDELDFDINELRELDAEEQLNYVFQEARHVNKVDVLPPSLGLPMFRTWMAHQEALYSYQPQPYDGRMIFFRPTLLAKANVPNMHLPWIDLVKGGIEIHQIPGNHITMNYNPNVKVIARHLKRALRNLRRGI